MLCIIAAPIGLLSSLLRLTVLEDEPKFRIPLLVPISLQEALGFEISLPREEIRFKCGDQQYLTSMVRERSAHRSMSVMEFAPEGWHLPAGCLAEIDCQNNNPFVLVSRADYTVPQAPTCAPNIYILDAANVESPTSRLVPLVRGKDSSGVVVQQCAD